MPRGYGTSQMPLAGAILCCTSIPPEQRTSLANAGAQMGAVIKLDLTSDVTHLIVGDTNSAKYRYVARCREDVKVLRPEWMEELRRVWMDGGEVDSEGLEKAYRLPTFYNLKICLTGFDNPDQRKYIQETVTQNGAEYHGDLTKAVTHLIAAAPTGKKYEHALNWKMKVVSIEWFDQSLERGMALEESYFLPTLSPSQRGKGAWERRQRVSPTLGKRTRDPEQAAVPDPTRRKLRRSASTKLGGQSDALWAGITAAVSQRQPAEEDEWTEESILRPDPTESTPVVDAAPADPEGGHAELPDSRRLPAKDGVFEGRAVLPFGFDAEKTKILRDALTTNGAAVFETSAELSQLAPHDLTRGFVVVPHDARMNALSLPGGAEAMTLTTNWWVEQCLFSKFLIDPTGRALCKPLEYIPVDGFEDVTISSTGFVGADILHMTKAVALMGATYDEYLTPKTSVLVCNTRNPSAKKLQYAATKRIPAVHADWLWDCLRTGHIQPFGQHAILIPPPDQADAAAKPKPPTPTVPFSAPDKAIAPQKKAQSAKPPLKPQHRSTNGRRGRPLDLSVSGNTNGSAINAKTATRVPFLDEGDEDEQCIPDVDGPASIPLQDINPGVNSPRRPSGSSTTSDPKSNHGSTTRDAALTSKAPAKGATANRPGRPAKEPTPDSAIPAPAPEEKDYSSIMSNILAQQKAAAQQNLVKGDETGKRRRKLGRATSNPSTAGETSKSSSGTTELQPVGAATTSPSHDKADPPVGIYQPSQELGWEAPGAREAREKMIRAMGGTVEESGEVVESLGVMKDMVGAGRLGRRKKA